MSLAGGLSSGETLSACAATPMNEPTRFGPSGLLVLRAPCIARPTQTMPCCMASVTKYISVEYLSPARLSEQVKPPAILSFHIWLNQGLALSSANNLNC